MFAIYAREWVLSEGGSIALHPSGNITRQFYPGGGHKYYTREFARGAKYNGGFPGAA